MLSQETARSVPDPFPLQRVGSGTETTPSESNHMVVVNMLSVCEIEFNLVITTWSDSDQVDHSFYSDQVIVVLWVSRMYLECGI